MNHCTMGNAYLLRWREGYLFNYLLDKKIVRGCIALKKHLKEKCIEREEYFETTQFEFKVKKVIVEFYLDQVHDDNDHEEEVEKVLTKKLLLNLSN